MPNDAPLPLARPGLLSRLGAELRRHVIAYSVVLAFLVIGPVLVRLIFPEAPLLIGLIGGLAFGIYAALAAVPDRFFE